jgi:DNA repair exonuclease SbcCD ATPase subunit
VNSALAQLAIEHNESASLMVAQFNIDYGLGSDLYAGLLDEQAQLNTTKAASIELKHRLTDAVEHLEKVHKELFQRGQSLRAFSKRMASKPLPDAAPTPESGSFVNELNDTQFSSFLQVGSSHGKILPNVSQVLTKPEEIFSALSSHVNKLGERLTAVERQGQEHMSALKQSLEANLTDQKDHIGNETAENTQLKADIDQLNGNIAHLRSTADDLKRKNKNLVEDLKSLHRNMSTIEEFAMNSLNTSEEQLTTAPQLQVLQELAQKEQEMEHQHAHSQSLSAVSAAKGAISLIQIDDDAHGLVEYLNNALQQLASEQNASEASMTASFQKDYSEGADQLAALAEEQQNLKTSKSDALELQAKLQAAVDHLETTHKHLTENSQAVRGFAQRMGLKPLPLEPEESASLIQLLSLFNCKSLLNNPFAHSPCSSLLKKSPAAESVSLLQLGSTSFSSSWSAKSGFVHADGSTDEEVVKNADLPSVPEVMTGPKHMFDTMSAQVSNLEARLAEVQKKNQDEMIDMKHKYDGNLTGTKTENTNITSQNSALKADINRINKSVRKLRSRANQLESDNGILLLDMQKMKANLTTAQEFTTKAMNSSDEMLFTAPELHVLTELAKKEDQMGSERAHSSRMGEVSAASGMSLLQVDSSESKNTKKSKRTKESKRTQPAKHPMNRHHRSEAQCRHRQDDG